MLPTPAPKPRTKKQQKHHNNLRKDRLRHLIECYANNTPPSNDAELDEHLVNIHNTIGSTYSLGTTLSFLPTLTSQERRFVHSVAANANIYHYSIGQGEQRHICVSFTQPPSPPPSSTTTTPIVKPQTLFHTKPDATSYYDDPKFSLPHPHHATIGQLLDQVPVQAAALRTSVLSTKPRTSPAVASTPLVMVNTVNDLLSLSLALSNTTEFAVDLEMNNMRSYNGLTCLIQISTRTTDYIIDALQLWDVIHFHLAPLFQNPGIVKIFHSCSGGDVPALHRDFNIYCINVFDTQIAAQMHIGRQVSLEFLLTDYLIPSCLPSKKISALKSTWTCTDWRQRPLPTEAILYARMDTHYLIELKERLVLDMCGGHEESRSTLHDEMDSALMAAAAFGKSMDGTLARRVPVFVAPPDSSSEEEEGEEEEGEEEGKGKRQGGEHHTKTTSAALIGSSDVQEDELCHCLFLSHKCSTSTFRAKKRPVQLLKKDKWYKRCCKQWRRTKEKKEVLYSMLFQWRDTIARTHDECSHYVCPSEILVCLTKKVPRNGAALTQTWTPLPPLLATVAVQESLFQVIQQWASEHQVVEDGERKTSQDTRNSNLLLALPSHLWKLILAFFGYKDYTLTGRTCQYLRRLWTEELHNHHIAGTLFVPVDCNTLKEAVDRVHEEDRLTTIVVGQGEHQIAGSYLVITSAMNIVGEPGVPKEEIVVVAGIELERGIQGNCHLQHLTLRQAMDSGVFGRSSFTMDDVLVEQCGYSGVWAFGTSVVARCTNVEVRQCGWSGVSASDGASITLTGAKTTVHHNSTKGNSSEYGLQVWGTSSSTIQLVSPLTKEHVSIDNGGGGNWGAEKGGDINQIKTMAEAEVEEKSDEGTALFEVLPPV
jgi:ribonuclease D